MHPFRSPAALLVLVLAALATGCTGTPQGRQVMLTDSAGTVLLAPPMVEIENENGTVTVVVDPQERRPRVTAEIYPDARMTKSMRESAASGSAFSANVTEGDGGPVVKVRGGPPEGKSGRVEADLTVRLATCRGITVRNAGGAVRLINVAGPISVENGVAGGKGGLIIVRTGQPVADPVTLTTTEGDVFLQVPPASAGRVDLLSLDGEAVFRAQGGRLTGVSPTFSSYRAVLNGGENPIVLRSGRGIVRITVLDDAGTHIPAE